MPMPTSMPMNSINIYTHNMYVIKSKMYKIINLFINHDGVVYFFDEEL
jgi:hypothetical protein